MTAWLVVPTRGDHPDLLDGIAALGHPTVVVVTADGVRVPVGCHAVYDPGPVNIHRWWNRGLDYAQERGATVAVVLNDDVSLGPDAVDRMVRQLKDTDAWLCGAATQHMTGWCWALDLTSPLRPDERFRWFYGDNDLWLRAAHEGRLTGVDVDHVHHHPNEATASSPDLTAITRDDEVAFRLKWGA